MAQGINRENFFGYEQFLFINGLPVPGVQSFDGSFSLPVESVVQLGGGGALLAPRGAKVGQVNVNSILISSDPFYYLTGNLGVNGFLIKDLSQKFTDNFSFISGYLTSYSNQYSIGGLPQVQANFQVFSNMGEISSQHPPHIVNELNNLNYESSGIFQDIHLGCASVSFTEVNSNPLISYELNINCPRIPIYSLKRDTPQHILQGKPIEINLNLQFEDATFSQRNMKGYPFQTNNETITITLSNKSSQIVNTYSLGSMNFVSSKKQSTVDGPDIRTLTYKRILG